MPEQQRVLEYVQRTGVDCPHCGYSLRGLTAPQCPECGQRIRMAHLLGPRHRQAMFLEWVVVPVLIAVNVYVVWQLWYHPPAAAL